jgi:glucose/arabinose dehydrogenase
VARRNLFAVAIACLVLGGCGGSGAPLEAVELAVPEGMDRPPFDVARRIVVPRGWSAELWARVPGARFAVWTPEGDLLVSRPQEGTVVRLSRRPGRGVTQRVVVSGLFSPHGLAFDSLDGRPVLYVAAADELVRYAWLGRAGAGRRTVVAADLPDPDGIDRLKGVAVGRDHSVFVSVGSMSEGPGPRAVVLAFDRAGRRSVYARGIRNAEGLSFGPDGALWAASNGGEDVRYPFHRAAGGFSDAYGKEIQPYSDTHPPDEIVRVTRGRNVGWPFCNANPDRAGLPRYGRLPFVADVTTNPRSRRLDCGALAPVERGLPAHSAPLGLRFLHASELPAPWSQGAVVALHGSLYRPELREPEVLWLPWRGATLGAAQTLMRGFQLSDGTRWGRPADAVPGPDGALYVTDDDAGAVYRLAPP